MFLLSPPAHPKRHPLGPGRFPPASTLSSWWREGDLTPPVPWVEDDCHGWVLPGYEHFSLAAIPWEQLRRGPVDHWRGIKKASSRRVARFDCPDSPDALFVKWTQIRGVAKTLGGLFRPSRAAREFTLARRLLVSGFLTPAPLLFAERRSGPVLRESWLVTRGLDPGWASVRGLWVEFVDGEQGAESGSPGAGVSSSFGEADRLLLDLGRAVRAFHDCGFLFADSRAHHWFTLRDVPDRDAPATLFRRWAVLDLDGSHLGPPPPPRVRRDLLSMLLASFPRSRWTLDHSCRVLQAYYHGQPLPESESAAILRESDRLYLRSRRCPPPHPPQR